jgi:hypothetical protein
LHVALEAFSPCLHLNTENSPFTNIGKAQRATDFFGWIWPAIFYIHFVGNLRPYFDSTMKPLQKASPLPDPVEWDLSESFGVLPPDLPLNHNLGCVRTPSSKKEADKPQPADPSAKK